MKAYTFSDLFDLLDHHGLSELKTAVERELDKKPELKNDTCGDIYGLLFLIDWSDTPEGKKWWFDHYLQVGKLEALSSSEISED